MACAFRNSKGLRKIDGGKESFKKVPFCPIVTSDQKFNPQKTIPSRRAFGGVTPRNMKMGSLGDEPCFRIKPSRRAFGGVTPPKMTMKIGRGNE
jgi:hypothetical protein